MTECPNGHVNKKPGTKPPRQGSGVPWGTRDRELGEHIGMNIPTTKPNPFKNMKKKPTKTTFSTGGIEVIRRTVKKSGSGAHIYVPKEWLDETVVVIRTGE